ncbi:phytoene/squalene synthase family protein [Piscinibacter aquaticus]|uniref:Phytoene/squalene synthase family protein n=1 Tax=Piscinibacter aquaticus TaxID=392597 RepID=A0A5C6U3Z5_9BURK|nr:phytoene/squalene synthase family protein [Piscinibacter aquaticus]
MSSSTPELPASRPALPAYDLQVCRALMRGGSKTFFAASLLLPARVRAPASALYAFCRLADDEIDLGADPARAMRGLEDRLDDIYDGRPQAIDADRALAAVVHRFAIPRALLDALLDGFLWDSQGRHYETLEDVQAYGARVAGTVGAMMALVMGTRDGAALARACELGVAMQLTNIARDVGEDARNGRLYLPRRWLREAGIDPDAWLAAPAFDDRIAGIVQRLLEVADDLYRRSEAGICALPRDCRPAICAARLVYAEIGRQLERQGLDSIGQRAVVSRQRKLALIARATAAAWGPSGGKRPQPSALPAVQYLVDACHAAPPALPAFDEPIGRVGRVIEIFERQMVSQRTAR